MDLSSSVLGQTAATHLKEQHSHVLLKIGSDGFTRRDLSRVSCYNFVAARNLSQLLNQELTVKNTRDVFDRISPFALALPRLGVIALAVLGAAFEAKRIGGERPLEAWMKHHAERDDKRPIVTFDSVKTRAKHADRIERKAKQAERRASKRANPSLRQDADAILAEAR
jgi:uncharacterized protein YbaP (TraB family)